MRPDTNSDGFSGVFKVCNVSLDDFRCDGLVWKKEEHAGYHYESLISPGTWRDERQKTCVAEHWPEARWSWDKQRPCTTSTGRKWAATPCDVDICKNIKMTDK